MLAPASSYLEIFVLVPQHRVQTLVVVTTDAITGVRRPDRLPQLRQPETLKFAQCRVTVAVVLRHHLQQRASQSPRCQRI